MFVVWPSVLRLNNLKVLEIHKPKQFKKFVYTKKFYKKYASFHLYNPGLALAEKFSPVYNKPAIQS